MKNNKLSILLKGIIIENPVLVLVLGTCPTLAQTGSVIAALGRGVAATLVLVCSNIVISALRKLIPDTVRIPCYIVVIAGFVSVVQLLMQAFLPALYDMMGVYLALIVVNCIILGRAEMFACKNKILPSILDGLGMGLGFTASLIIVGSIREILGTGKWFGMTIAPDFIQPMTIFILPAGGFFTLGCVIAIVGKLTKKKPKKIGCECCPSREACTASCKEEK